MHRIALSSFILFACVLALANLVTAQGVEKAGMDPQGPGTQTCFVANCGQWDERVRFVHRGQAITTFLGGGGWTLELRTADAGAALRMTFAGADSPVLTGEGRLRGVHNYFLGPDPRRWYAGVPLFTSVLYRGVYPGVDVRMRFAGHPEYDLLLAPDADLGAVVLRVEGADGLRLDEAGQLWIDTPLGALRQPKPRTFERLADGTERPVDCRFVLVGDERFGFAAPTWSRRSELVVDPGLIWSTHLGGTGADRPERIATDPNNVITVLGGTQSTDFPTTLGAYDTTYNTTRSTAQDLFVSRLDPKRSPASAQLVFSTFLGGEDFDTPKDMHVDKDGVITITGGTSSIGFPTTANAYDTSNSIRADSYVTQLDPRLSGTAQLVYSTFLGPAGTTAVGTADDGTIWVAGSTHVNTFPVTSGAYSTAFRGGLDVIVARLDPSKVGAAQLAYSSYIGGAADDGANDLVVESNTRVTLCGYTGSSDYPTANAYDPTYNGGGTYAGDCVLTTLDTSRVGAAQLVYSTYLGGSGGASLDREEAFAVHATGTGIVTMVGQTTSPSFPTTTGAFDTTANGSSDAFACRLDTTQSGGNQLVYSTYLGGSGRDMAYSMAIDAAGAISLAGDTQSLNLPTTSNAYSPTTANNFGDAMVSRIDPSKPGVAGLTYSTYFGSLGGDNARGIGIDASGTATIVGISFGVPATAGSYSPTPPGSLDGFITRFDMGQSLYADAHAIDRGEATTFTLDAGTRNAGRSYWVFGSVSGSSPGIRLNGIDIPLNPDFFTDLTITLPNSSVFPRSRGVLDGQGRASSGLAIPASIPPILPIPVYFSFVVYDAQGRFYEASNATVITVGSNQPPTPLSVTATAPGTPTQPGIDVEPDAKITATFNQALDTSTILPSHFVVSDGFSGVSGKLAYDATKNSVEFLPKHRLSLSKRYSVTIKGGGIKAKNGASLAADVVFTFAVRKGVWQLDSNGSGSPVDITPTGMTSWDSLTQATTAGGTTILAFHSGGNIWVAQYEPGQAIGSMKPGQSLAPGHSPHVTMDEGGRAYLTWVRGSEVYASNYLPGMGWSQGLQISATPTGRSVSAPEVAMEDSGDAIIAWIESTTGVRTIMANAYDKSKPNWGAAAPVVAIGSSFGKKLVSVTRGSSSRHHVVLVDEGSTLTAYSRPTTGSVWTAQKLNVSTGQVLLGDALALADGRLVVSWREDDPSSSTIRLDPILNVMDGAGKWDTAQAAVVGTESQSLTAPPTLDESAGGEAFRIAWARDNPNSFNDEVSGGEGDPTKPWNKTITVNPGSSVVISPGCSKATRAEALSAGAGSAQSAHYVWLENNPSCTSCVHVRQLSGTTWQPKLRVSLSGRENTDLQSTTSGIGESVLSWTEKNTSTNGLRLVVNVFR